MTDSCAPDQSAWFKIDDGKIYMSTSSSSEGYSQVANSFGDLTQGTFPPSNYQIQQIYPTFGFLTSGDATKANDAAFTAHSGFASQGDNTPFSLCVSSSAAKVYSGYFMMKNNSYYMSKTDDTSTMKLLGKVTGTLAGADPPSNAMIQKIFPSTWLASGTREQTLRANLFHQHSGFASNGDGQIFEVHIFDGPQ